MDIFNHLAYNTTGEEVDNTFHRCDYCRSYPHSCIFYLMLANIDDEKYIHGGWCIDKPKEKENKENEGNKENKGNKENE